MSILCHVVSHRLSLVLRWSCAEVLLRMHAWRWCNVYKIQYYEDERMRQMLTCMLRKSSSMTSPTMNGREMPGLLPGTAWKNIVKQAACCL